MSSDSPWTLSGMKENNRRHEAPIRAFLTEIVRQPQTHAKFMNMLSMLEHMGSRKIMISQMNETLTEDSLKHLAEEARHAYFFKRQAERAAKKSQPKPAIGAQLSQVAHATTLGMSNVPAIELRVISNTTGTRAQQRWDLPGALARLTQCAGVIRAWPA